MKLEPAIGFGEMIAFFLPGCVMFRALAYHSPWLEGALQSLSSKDASLGAIFLVSVASSAIGVALSVFRSWSMDKILNRINDVPEVDYVAPTVTLASPCAESFAEV